MIPKKKGIDSESAVSVLVGTLALILVVVIGVTGIALILGTFSTEVSKETSPSQSVTATKTPVNIAGSDNMDLLTRSLADTYEEENPSLRIKSGIIPPDGVYPAIISKTVDIGALSGHITYADITKNPNIQTRQIGSSAVVFITNKDDPGVSSVATPVGYDDLKNFFTDGTINGAIVTGAEPVIRSDSSGTADTLYNNFFGTSTVKKILGYPSQSSDNAVISYVASTPKAIGFADYGDVQTAITSYGEKISIISIEDGFRSYSADTLTYDTLKNATRYDYRSTARHADGSLVWTGNQSDIKDYNLSLVYPLYYVTKDRPNVLEASILDYAISPAARPAFTKVNAFSIADF
jgi:ABC-type phosphate transport system substrate-binding protein